MPRILPIALIILMLPSPPAGAADPALPWNTFETPHFEIHYHAGTRDLAVRVAHIAEAALERVAEALEHLPWGRIQLVLTDHSDSANGSASVLPYNLIHALASAPEDLNELNDFDDHMWILVLHEIVHIVHMDTISGIPAASNGRVTPMAPSPARYSSPLVWQAESTTRRGPGDFRR